MSHEETTGEGREIKLTYLDYIGLTQVKFKICADLCVNSKEGERWVKSHHSNCLTLQNIIAKLAN